MMQLSFTDFVTNKIHRRPKENETRAVRGSGEDGCVCEGCLDSGINESQRENEID